MNTNGRRLLVHVMKKAKRKPNYRPDKTRKRMQQARSKAVIKKDKLLSDLRDIQGSIALLRRDLKGIETGIDSIVDFDAKIEFVKAVRHIASHQELRAPLLLLIDAVNGLSNNLLGRHVSGVPDAINTLGLFSKSLGVLTELMGKKHVDASRNRTNNPIC